jgi:hypothetical protein
VLHALLDAMVHQRDITEPLGRSAPAAPELLPVLAYTLLTAARVACLADREFAVPVDLDGQVLAVAVRGAVVEVVPVGRNGELGPANVATRADLLRDAVFADPLRLLDGLTGREPLDEVLPASDDVRAALGLLAPSL